VQTNNVKSSELNQKACQAQIEQAEAEEVEEADRSQAMKRVEEQPMNQMSHLHDP
jgi:hypothetical protein